LTVNQDTLEHNNIFVLLFTAIGGADVNNISVGVGIAKSVDVTVTTPTIAS